MSDPVSEWPTDSEMTEAGGEAAGRQDYNIEFTWKKYSICGTLFDLPSYYQVLKPIGQGAYGVVCCAKNEITGATVAIKKISNVFAHVLNAKRTLREAQLLRIMKHENIISILDILPPVNMSVFEDVYVVSELMDTDLHQIIQTGQHLSQDHVQYFMYQILCGIKYIHGCNVVHRDLKPSNLLLNQNCDLKICDFGLARSLGDPDGPSFLTEYVATRWYRAPEVLLSWRRYSKALDMWSVGCIFAELFVRRPVFPGSDYRNQLDRIYAGLGSPSESDLHGVSSHRALQYVRSLPHHPKQPLSALVPTAPQQALEVMEGLFAFDPDRRMTVEQALSHGFFASLHDDDDEPAGLGSLDMPWEPQVDACPDRRVAKAAMQELIYDELRLYRPHLPPWAAVAPSLLTDPATRPGPLPDSAPAVA